MKEKNRKQKAAILAAAFVNAQGSAGGRGRGYLKGKSKGYLRGRGRGCGNIFKQSTTLGINQRALCKKKGHWKNECLENKKVAVIRPQQIPPEADLLMMGEDSE